MFEAPSNDFQKRLHCEAQAQKLDHLIYCESRLLASNCYLLNGNLEGTFVHIYPHVAVRITCSK